MYAGFMPELPEVETVKRGLKKLISRKTIKSVDFDWPKGFPNSKTDINKFLIGASIVDVKRRAKALIIDLDTNYSLVSHLKMTGQFVYVGEQRFGAGHPNDSFISQLPNSTTRVTFTFSDQTKLYFNDQRKFGWIRLIPTLEVENIDFMKKLGPEPLSSSTTAKMFIDNVARRKNSVIKAVIMDQSVIAGVGNIYADESLYASKIHPETRVKDLSVKQLKTLFKEIKFVLQKSIDLGGSTDRNYVDAEGKKGSYLQFAKVFRLEGTKCKICNNEIIKIRVAGRGTHICPVCQKHN